MSASTQVVTSLHYHAFSSRTAARVGRSGEERVAPHAGRDGSRRSLLGRLDVSIHPPARGATLLGSLYGLNAASLLDFEGCGSAFGDGEGIGLLAVRAGHDQLVGARSEVVPDRHWRSRVHRAIQAEGGEE